MKHNMKKISTFLLILCAAVSLGAAETPFLFRDGLELWKVTCRTEDDYTDPAVRLAAKELVRAMRLVSHAKKPSGEDAEALGKTVVCIGIDPKLKEEEIRIHFDGEKLQLSGGSSVSTIHAVYFFLQKELGVRWLFPGEKGEFMPRKNAYQIPEKMDIRHIPSIKYRGFHMCGDWYKVDEFREWMSRNFINIHRHAFNFKNEVRFYRMWSDHNTSLSRDYFKEHPEYFAEIDGRRIATQICLNHPEVDRLVYEKLADFLRPRVAVDIVSLFLPDNQEYCQCAKCKEKGVSTSWFDFYNRLTDKLKADFPRLKFATLAYQGYLAAPANPVRNTEFVEYASHNRCNIHKYGHPGCARNEKTYKQKLDWQATGTPMGDYAYEFDIFSGPNTPFTPFYSMIKDTVMKSVEDLKLAALIPEVGLSPKKDPDHQTHLKERLANYIYAQLMWDHTKTIEELIGEWCDLAYGNAAGKMKEYFIALDKQWDSMDIHFGILGNPMPVAEKFLTPEFLAKLTALLQAAEKDLNGEKNEAFEFEKTLLSTWMRHLEQGERIILPKIESAEQLSKDGGWEKDTLYLKLKAPFRVDLCAGFGGETWIFTADKDGKTKHWRRSTVGIDEMNWKADWSYTDGIVKIPFSALGTTPSANDKWQIKLSQNEQTPADETKTLFFCANSEVGKRVVYWSGLYPNDKWSYKRKKSDYNDFGWDIKFAETGSNISAMKPADIYFFDNPARHENPFPQAQWEFLRNQIRQGKTAVFGAYSNYPLEKILDDPTFKLGVGGNGNIQLPERRTRTIYPGDWTKTPYKIKKGIERGYTPAYSLTPAQPEYWRILATLPFRGGENAPERPYLMVRQYGKGTVICYARDLWFGIPPLIVNILKHRDELTQDLPKTELKAESAKEKQKTGKRGKKR